MTLKQIDHVALSCSDLEASKEWYVRVLGFEHIHAEKWEGVPIFLRLGSTYLALFPARDATIQQSRLGLRIAHFAMLADKQADFREAQQHLQAHGVPFEFQDHDISHSVHFDDPDGHQLEITTYDLGNEK